MILVVILAVLTGVALYGAARAGAKGQSFRFTVRLACAVFFAALAITGLVAETGTSPNCLPTIERTCAP